MVRYENDKKRQRKRDSDEHKIEERARYRENYEKI
jgi:hypothetical protein